MDLSDASSRRTLAHWATMIVLDPPRPPRLVGEVLGTVRLPDNLTEILENRFRTVCEDVGGGMSTEKRVGRGLQSFLAHLAPGVDLVPILERLFLLGVEQNITVHLFY